MRRIALFVFVLFASLFVATPAHANATYAPPQYANFELSQQLNGQPAAGPSYRTLRWDGGQVYDSEWRRNVGGLFGKDLAAHIVGGATMPTTIGYWSVASDGGVFSFGDAKFYGSMGGQRLNK